MLEVQKADWKVGWTGGYLVLQKAVLMADWRAANSAVKLVSGSEKT
jgi:hypothetical protein